MRVNASKCVNVVYLCMVEAMALEFVKSQKGRDLLLVNGYTFSRHYVRGPLLIHALICRDFIRQRLSLTAAFCARPFLTRPFMRALFDGYRKWKPRQVRRY